MVHCIRINLLVLFLYFTNNIFAEELQEIVVTSAPITELQAEPELDLTILEMLQPAMQYTQGGYGGFAGFRERGQQTIHSQIYRNGIPVNDSGTGWYDFAHDIPTGSEKIKVVHGGNSTIYGSGSLAGTVFIEDTFDDRLVFRYGSRSRLLHVSNELGVSFTAFDAKNDSVRSDNEEKDRYKNYTFRGKYNNFNIVYTDYSYDYDRCYQPTFTQVSELEFNMSLWSNDCKQEGERGTLSYNNDNLTLGYSFNNANFPNEGNGYKSKSERFYGDARNEYGDLLYGATINAEKFAGQTRERIEAYAEYDGFSFRTDGTNVAARVGFMVPVLTGVDVAIGSAYREPTLYEQYGDAYVMSNNNLDAEESYGIDVSLGPVTAFAYNFNEGITYNFDFNQFENTGGYSTSGVRFMDNYNLGDANVNVMVGYTDSDQQMVSPWMGSITAQWKDLTAQVSSNQWVTTVDVSYEFNGMFASITNITDEKYEIQNGYPLGGIEYHVGYNLKY